MIAPNSKIILLKCPLKLDNKNQINFSNASEQYNYFNSLDKDSVGGCTYQRRDEYIAYPKIIDDILEYNYVMYQNTNYSNKWFYAYITDITYVNDNLSYVYIKEDPFQTWQFDLNYKVSFVEREHVNDDSVGLHTVPENLETGEYVCNSKVDVFTGSSNTTACIMVSDVPDDIYDNLPAKLPTYNSVFSGCYIFVANPETVALSITNFLRIMDKAGKGDGVVSIFMIPNNLLPTPIDYQNYTYDNITTNLGLLPSTTGATLLETSANITVPSTLNGYTPKNNKLKVFPYSYFYVTNNINGNVDFKYEEFVNNTAQFKTIGSITPGCSIRCIPLNYKKLTDNNTYNSFNASIPVSKYPICSWKTDTYINWLTQEGLNNNLSILGGMVSTASGIVTGNPIAVASGVLAIGQTMANNYTHSLIPDQARGNTNSGDVTFSAEKINITAYKMSVRDEYARIIDNYFSAYGYKVNSYKIPNITGRRNWNFVKTIDCNILGDVPQESIEEVKIMFNNGLTIWHNPTTYLDYSQSNNII